MEHRFNTILPEISEAITNLHKLVREHASMHPHLKETSCPTCSVYYSRLEKLEALRARGATLVPVENLELDRHGELCFRSEGGITVYGERMVQAVDRQLERYGLRVCSATSGLQREQRG